MKKPRFTVRIDDCYVIGLPYQAHISDRSNPWGGHVLFGKTREEAEKLAWDYVSRVLNGETGYEYHLDDEGVRKP
jgi:hypothetical protein